MPMVAPLDAPAASLRDRVALPFAEGAVIYDMGETQRALWFVRGGVVKIGTITADGREIIYDVRKEGDVVGELCAFEPIRLKSL